MLFDFVIKLVKKLCKIVRLIPVFFQHNFIMNLTLFFKSRMKSIAVDIAIADQFIIAQEARSSKI